MGEASILIDEYFAVKSRSFAFLPFWGIVPQMGVTVLKVSFDQKAREEYGAYTANQLWHILLEIIIIAGISFVKSIRWTDEWHPLTVHRSVARHNSAK